MIDFYRSKEQPKASLDATEVLGWQKLFQMMM
jgi:hypothetical protein